MTALRAHRDAAAARKSGPPTLAYAVILGPAQDPE